MPAMDAPHAIAAFAVAAGLLTVTPGMDTALVLRTAAVEGSRRGMQAAIGILAGCLVWGLVASVGLGALLAASQMAYEAMRVAGALYMLWLGGRMIVAALRGGVKPPATETPTERDGGSWILRGFLTNVLNPKVGMFYVTFLPLFVPAGVNVTGFSMLLAVIHVAESVLWFWLLTTAMKPLARWIQRGGVTRALDGITGGVLIAFGVGLFFERR
jgi:threonine/homoserine/homoserine lactone efflux protein